MSKPKIQLENDIYHVLVADDSESDRLLIRIAIDQMARLRLAAEVSNGDGVVSYLSGKGQFDNRKAFPAPDLLLLDLKMPGRDGFGVLDWLRSEECRDLIVVVLTDSMEPAHIKRALDLGADLYQVKPRTTDERLSMLAALEDYLIQASAPRQYSRARLTAQVAVRPRG